MKDSGYEGLASAIILQACRDYIGYKRWLMKNGKPVNATKRIEMLKRDRKRYINHKQWEDARIALDEIRTLKTQSTKETKIEELMEFFHSEFYHNICSVDPDFLIRTMDERIPDPTYNIAFEDFG